MSQVNPPNQYFPTIIYNPQFWTSSSSSGQYLGRTGTPTSIASLTTFTGGITAQTVNATSQLQIAGTSITSLFPTLSGDNTFTGNNTFSGGTVNITNAPSLVQTMAIGTATQRTASTAFVNNYYNNRLTTANSWSGIQTFTASPLAPTVTPDTDSTTKVASTAFTQSAINRILTTANTWTNTNTFSAIVATDLTVTNVIQGTALRSNQAYSTNNNANATHYLTYTDQSTNGYGQLQKHATLTFNPNQEILTAQTINATSQLRIGGTDITSLFLSSSFSSACALLASSNTFTASNDFQGLVYINDPPIISNYLTASFADNNLITKKYADSRYPLIASVPTLIGNNTFTGNNTFGTVGSLKTTTFNDLNNNFTQNVTFTQPPSCSASPSVSTQLTNKNYVDTEIQTNCALVASANTYTNVNTFNSGLKSSVSPTLSTDVVNKSYADTNLSNSALLSGTNTWSGDNTFSSNTIMNGNLTIGTVTSSTSTLTLGGSGILIVVPSNMQIQSKFIERASGTLVSSALTISVVPFTYYSLDTTSSFSITMRTPTAGYIGTRITFRRVSGNPANAITSASANIYPSNSNTAGTALLPANVYSVTVVCLLISGTTHGWFVI
jgi:hypothetical protein